MSPPSITRRNVVDFVRKSVSVTSLDVASQLGVSVKLASHHLERAEQDGTLACDRKLKPYIYTIADPVPEKGMRLTRQVLTARILEIDAEIASLRMEREMLVRAVGS